MGKETTTRVGSWKDLYGFVIRTKVSVPLLWGFQDYVWFCYLPASLCTTGVINSKSFMETDAFHKFSTKYGLDSEIVATFCESFAAHVDLPKEKWFKYHPPIELNEEPVSVKEETIVQC